MNKLEKMRLFLASCMMGMAVSIVSCSSENGENDILDGKGTIRLGNSHTLICRQSPWNWITERIR